MRAARIGLNSINGFNLNLTVASNVNNLNLLNLAVANNWNSTIRRRLNLSLTINSGVTVGSTTYTNPALNIGGFPTNSKITIINNGNIWGAGGIGGSGGSDSAGSSGTVGGDAILLNNFATITNNGNIYGGGGGGGGGGAGQTTQSTGEEQCRCCDASNCDGCPAGGNWDPCAGYRSGYILDCFKSGCCATNGCDKKNYCDGRTCIYYAINNNPSPGGSGGFGRGSNNSSSGSGAAGTNLGASGGNGGGFGGSGLSGGSASFAGGSGGLAGHYIRNSAFATFVNNGSVSGRIA